MQLIRDSIDQIRKCNKKKTRKKEFVQITIIEQPQDTVQIQFKIPKSGTKGSLAYIYKNKELSQKHTITSFKRFCDGDGCCTKPRKVVIFAKQKDFKSMPKGLANNISNLLIQYKLLAEATIIELKYGVQVYFYDKISIHGRKSPDDSKIHHSVNSKDEFSCYPRIIAYRNGKLHTSLITTVNNG